MDFDSVLGEYVLDPFEHRVADRCIRADVYRRSGSGGPPVILIHEAPGLSASTLALADRIRDRGFSVVLPAFLTRPEEAGGLRRMVGGLFQVCIASEFGALTRGQTTPIATWLRALAKREADLAKVPSVGVIGMCFSGGFALATALEPVVGAAVMSQPSLPFLFATDFGVSEKDTETLKERIGTGGCVRLLRYQADWKSPRDRYDRLACTFPDIERVEIPTRKRSKHSVLKDGLSAPRESHLGQALEGTLSFLEGQLGYRDERAAARRGART